MDFRRTSLVIVKKVKDLIRLVLIFCFTFLSIGVVAQEQTVSASLDISELRVEQSTELTIVYSATNSAKTSGLGLRLHFDSSVIQMDAYTERLFTGSQPFQFKDDTTDLDGDPNTDKYYLTSWADTSGAGWPVDGNTGNPLEQPLTLYVVPLTALSGYNGTTLNFLLSINSSTLIMKFSSKDLSLTVSGI